MTAPIATKRVDPESRWLNSAPSHARQPRHQTKTVEIDSWSFGAAFEKHFQRTVRFLLSQGAAIDTAEEVAQGAWARAWEHRDQLNHGHLLCPWVHSIAKNLLKNRARSDRRWEPLPDEVFCRDDGGTLHLQQLLGLCGDAGSAALVRAYYVNGYTAEELARDAGLSASAIRVRLFRIRTNIRAALLNNQVCGNPSSAEPAASRSSSL